MLHVYFCCASNGAGPAGQRLKPNVNHLKVPYSANLSSPMFSNSNLCLYPVNKLPILYSFRLPLHLRVQSSLPVSVKTAEPSGGVIPGVAQGGSTQLRSSHEVKVYATSLPQHPGGRHRLIRWLSNSPANKHGSLKKTKLRAFLKLADFQRRRWYVGSSVFVQEVVWFTLLPPDANCNVEGLKKALWSLMTLHVTFLC